MRAQSLSISIANKGCDKNCPYCVSKITGMSDNNLDLMIQNLPKVKTLAKAAQVSTVLFTSKGEPFKNYDNVLFFLKMFKEYWTEIQTNGYWLNDNKKELTTLRNCGLNVIAISIDSLFDIEYDLFQSIRKAGMINRITLNIINDDFLGWKSKSKEKITFQDLVEICKQNGIHQMTLRNIIRPNNTENNRQTNWIDKNVDKAMYDRLRNQMIEACDTKGQILRNLEYGAKVYDYEGISISYSDYCVQDFNNGNDIRSLIFMEDGHIYTSWNSKASILF